MKSIIILLSVILFTGEMVSQTIKIPSRNTNSSGSVTSSSAKILIPRRIKINRAVAEIDTVMKQNLENLIKQKREENVITDNIQTSVSANVVEEINEQTGEKVLNFHVEYKYQVVKASIDKQTSDFPAGKYKLISSDAAKTTMQLVKQAVENQLEEYLTPGTKVTIKITGSTDGSPINNTIPYTGEYGDFNGVEYFYNGNLSELTLTQKTGIKGNEQLAFLRTYGVRDFIEKYVEQLRVTNNTFQHYAVVSTEIGAEYRRISVEFIIHDAFRNKFTENKEVVEEAKPSEIEKPVENRKSDVDLSIPLVNKVYSKRYALIIGNEDYTTYNKGLNKEVNVDYAENDALVFTDYCKKILGIPESQIKLLINATGGQMSEGLEWLSYMSKIENGEAELFFYYSGHGLPEESTNKPFLIPVDVSGTSLKHALPLGTVYKSLTQLPCKRASVFLDACFSGGARNQGLVAVKGVKIKPAEEKISGNLIVLASSSEEESSAVYREQQHGYFTYFLLQKIKEAKGQITYKELINDIIYNVQKETGKISKKQTPQVLISPSVSEDWVNWKLNN